MADDASISASEVDSEDLEDYDDVPLNFASQPRAPPPALTGGAASGATTSRAGPSLPGLGLSRLASNTGQQQAPATTPSGTSTSGSGAGGLGFKLAIPARSPPVGPAAASPAAASATPGSTRERREPDMEPELDSYSPPPTTRGERPPMSLSLPLATSRGPPKPPMLTLANAASATPVPSGNNTPWATPAVNNNSAAHSMDTAREASLAMSASTLGGTSSLPSSVAVDLVSVAFTLENLQDESEADGPSSSSSSPLTAAELIKRRCCSSLGVAHEELSLFELRPITGGQLPMGCTRVGVMVNRSGFTMAALEELLRQNKQSSQVVSLLAEMQRSVQESNNEATRQAVVAAQQAAELEKFRANSKLLEQQNLQLKEQLQQCDEQRKLLAKTITTLRSEFEDLKHQSLQHHHASAAGGSGLAAISTPQSSQHHQPLQPPLSAGQGASRQLTLSPAGPGVGGGGVLSPQGPGRSTVGTPSSSVVPPLSLAGLGAAPAAGAAGEGASRTTPTGGGVTGLSLNLQAMALSPGAGAGAGAAGGLQPPLTQRGERSSQDRGRA